MGNTSWRDGWINTVTAALFTLIAPAASAEDDFAFLKVDAIRSAYESARAGWTYAPDLVEKAFVAAEDKNFFDRPTSRSTLTASLAFWYPEQGGKSRVALTVAIGQALDREEVLDWLVHAIFLGQGCFGVDQAADAYFGKGMNALALHEAAFLAALAKAPASYHPLRAPDRALAARNHVITTMAEAGFVTVAQAENSIAKPLGVRDPLGTCAAASP